MAKTPFDRLVEDGKRNPMSPEEKREQRVSMAMGLKSRNSKITRALVERALDRSEGVRSDRKGARSG